MSLSEFDLIARFFSDCGAARNDVILGVGDDAALLAPPPGMELAVTQDSLVAGVHFLPDTDPRSLGHKALAVNLSDLAAMGAEPAWATLALTLPDADPEWLAAFSEGFCALASAHGVRLVGGDTTRGPLAFSIAAFGFVPRGGALRRQGARPGDRVAVTGTLGDAGLALKVLQQGLRLPGMDAPRQRLDRPTPRVREGRALRGFATAAIDISDGLLADLGHLVAASGLGARVALQRLPLSRPLRDWVLTTGDWSLPLGAGDDYELCFAVPPARWPEVQRELAELGCPCACIGEITGEPGVRVYEAEGEEYRPRRAGFDHFRDDG